MAVFIKKGPNTFHRLLTFLGVWINIKELLKLIDVEDYSTAKREKQGSE